MGRHACLPLEGSEVIGHRANDIGFVRKQINVLITVKIDCKLGPTGGHELRQTHGACVAAFDLGRFDFFFGDHDQELRQLFGEKGLALGRSGMR